MENSQASPDISALLRSLTASLSQQTPMTEIPHQAHWPPQPTPPPPHMQPPEASQCSPRSAPNTQLQLHQYPQTAHQNPQSYDQLPTISNKQNAAAAKLHVDPRDIRMWPLALKYLSLLLAHYPDVAERVKRMIANQHENERVWWAGRQTLIRQLASRDDGRKKVNDVLRAIGAAKPHESADEAEVDPETELKKYDEKVHTAMKQMNRSMTSELGDMEIPFFCTRKSLVSVESISTDYDPARSFEDLEVKDGSRAANTETISIKELTGLQDKTLEFLEEYSKD